MSNGLRQEDPVRRLLEKDAVISAVNRLFRSVDDRDWEEARSCFAPAVYLDMASVSGAEPALTAGAEIVAGWSGELDRLDAVHHQAGNYEVEVHGEEASARCNGTAWHHRAGEPGGRTTVFVGSYDVGLRKQRGVWKIHRLRYDLKFVDGNGEDEGSA